MLKVVTKNMFFDRSKVLDRLEKKRARVLARTGGYTRSAMQRSMRYVTGKGKPSKPGKPPKARRKNPLLRKLIAFGLDSNDTVVVGPLASKSSTTVNVPELLNEGGTARIVLPGGERVRARYMPRPFATPDSPAGSAGQNKFEELIEETPL